MFKKYAATTAIKHGYSSTGNHIALSAEAMQADMPVATNSTLIFSFAKPASVSIKKHRITDIQ